MPSTPETTYQSVGVDTHTEELGLHLLTKQIEKTWPRNGLGAVKLEIGAFANVLDIGGGLGLAISADGVGSKVLIAQAMEKYDTVGIDCVAMNVNDIICVGARPLSMVDYIAIEEAEPNVLAEIAKGLTEGAQKAGISIPGGEIAQLPDVFRKHECGVAFDIAGMAVGTVQLDRILVGKGMQPGDVVIGIASSGIHSNGVTLARKVLLTADSTVRSAPKELCGRTIGEELLTPTHIYVQEAVELLEKGIPVRAFAHITSDGFLNLPRVAPEGLGFELANLLREPPIFSLIRERGGVHDTQMFVVYNMGVGFCIVVAPEGADAALATVCRHGKMAQVIGRVIEDRDQAVYITEKRLKGIDKTFYEI
jgi:phosphoribosylformylglycinamidine cyclo-ligase